MLIIKIWNMENILSEIIITTMTTYCTTRRTNVFFLNVEPINALETIGLSIEKRKIHRSQHDRRKRWSTVSVAPSLPKRTNVRFGHFHRSMDKETACPSSVIPRMVRVSDMRAHAHKYKFKSAKTRAKCSLPWRLSAVLKYIRYKCIIGDFRY